MAYESKRKRLKFLLAPVDASRSLLQSAYLLLTEREAEFRKNDLEEVQKRFVSVARYFVPQDRNSFVVFQSKTEVEVCTFQLILKNASSFLDGKDSIKLEAEIKPSDLRRQRVAVALKDTITSLNNFEQGIKNCLEV